MTSGIIIETNEQNIGKSWPFSECKNIISSLKNKLPEKGYILFSTGYGPSGLPHIGTFGEVIRTVMVMNAMRYIAPETPMKLLVFSDDMDGLRKVPDNIPNKDLIANFISHKLTSIPDPFGQFESYGHYMNNKLCEFLDSYNFNYEFKSATQCYKDGIFNEKIKLILENYESIKSIVMENIGEERQKTYSPILPIDAENRVLLADIVEVDARNCTIKYRDESGKIIETSALNGLCKMQWRVDWATRWAAFDVNYEMHGKDLDSSSRIAQQICQIINNNSKPKLFRYELFLDGEGKKISKSKGNGMSVQEWIRYAPHETLSLYMHSKPSTAKRLHPSVVAKTVDDYIEYSQSFFKNEGDSIDIDNPLFAIHDQKPLNLSGLPYSFSLLVNVAHATNSSTKKELLNFISHYKAKGQREEIFIKKVIEGAINYNHDFKKQEFTTINIGDQEKKYLTTLVKRLEEAVDPSEKEIQSIIFNVSKEANYKSVKDCFKLIYNVLIKQDFGPKLGSFIKTCGIKKTIQIINDKINE